jgi:F-type H+-transporting ATPase subunit alpha
VPIVAEEQIAVLFAGTGGYLDDIPIESISRFEEEFMRHMRDSKADILKDIAEKKAIDEDLKGKLSAAIEDFKKSFSA